MLGLNFETKTFFFVYSFMMVFHVLAETGLDMLFKQDFFLKRSATTTSVPYRNFIT